MKHIKNIAWRACLSLAILAGTVSLAHAITLRENAVIQDTNIMLSDLFDGIPFSEDRILGPAPRPGDDMVLQARTLLRIAQALDLPWRPKSQNDYIVLSRAATIIDGDTIKEALSEYLKSHHDTHNKFELSFHGEFTEIVLPEGSPATFDITSLDFNPASGRFNAALSAPSKDVPKERVRVNGRMHKLIDVPVLRDTIRKGTRITKSDVRVISLRDDRISHDVIVNPHNVIGMTPRRMVKAGELIKAEEITTPKLVERGQSVTMIYENGGLNLTALGRALENGSKGDVVKVVNATSSRTVDALVTGDQEVTIREF